MKEKQDYLNQIFQLAVGAGMCRTIKDFALLLGVNKSGLSSAMNGSEKHLTDSLVRKVNAFAVMNGLEEGVEKVEKAKEKEGVYIPESTRAMFENMTETIRIQAQLLAQYQAVTAIGMQTTTSTQKNYQTK